ncbi:hypothetical protein WJX73_009848 [Symbiochloris irregularis]|uniref:Telomerase Cajal body protein 1 n=1 Tax=Symbiochloris irregularis TaxID=706552 RepID=A0AAW1PZ30_9CHLO
MDVNVDTEAAASELFQLSFGTQPTLVAQASNEYREGTSQARISCPQSNFLKGCKWSPDGACLLTASEDKWLRVYDLPPDCLESQSGVQSTSAQEELSPALRIFGNELIYDYAWYPGMVASEPSTCVLASTTRGQPLHLWDAYTGHQRATYRAYDQVDEVEAAYSLAFTPDGARILAGYRKRICIFDLARPGRDSWNLMTYQRKQEGLPGIVSCMACNPDRSSMVAAGAYSGTAALYALDSQELLVLLQGHRGGLTQVSFSPDGNFLYTGARRDPDIHCWDVRYTSGVVYSLQRDTSTTNQRVGFDIEPCGRHLATGGQDGKVKAFDLTTGQLAAEYRAAADTVNGLACHPCLPLVATASGHRRLAPLDSDDDDEMQSNVSVQKIQGKIQRLALIA